MRRLKFVALCAPIVLFVAAVGPTSASATLPEFQECAKLKMKTGEFTTSKCATKDPGHEGKWELEPGLGKKTTSTGKSGTVTIHVPAIGGELQCKSSSSKAELEGTKEEGEVVAKYVNCTALGKRCTSAGQVSGTVETNPLKGVLGYISGKGTAFPHIGVLMSAAEGEYISEANCEGLEVKSLGSVIAEITGDINEISPDSTTTLSVNGSGLQTVTHFEGGVSGEHEPLSIINGSGPFSTGIQSTESVHGEKLEIKG